MGFFGHLVVSRSDASELWADVEREPGPWAPGLHAVRVHEHLADDWTQINEFMTRLAGNVRGGFIGASVWDSDGAFVVVGVPGVPVGRYWLQIDRVIGVFVVPWAPFDEDGNPLSPEEAAAQEAEWNVEADVYREKMLGLALSTEDAANLCVNWARQSNLTPRSAIEVANVLTSTNVFVEETFGELLDALGAREGTRE